MKKAIPLLLLAVLTSVGFNSKNSKAFQYRYEVIGASNSVSDIYELYEYKEHLIETYDQYLLTLDSTYREEYLRSYISIFDYKEGKTQYVNGVIVQVIGKGYGRKVKGSLRVDSCDVEPIREKFFIFDIFS